MSGLKPGRILGTTAMAKTRANTEILRSALNDGGCGWFFSAVCDARKYLKDKGNGNNELVE